MVSTILRKEQVVRQTALLLFGLSLAVAGCLPQADPLAPELKGRWAAPQAAKLRQAFAQERYAAAPPAPAPADCRNEYVTFQRSAVVVHANAQESPVMIVEAVERAGDRLVLRGRAPFVAGGGRMQIELRLRGGKVRLDDVLDEKGRSRLYERFDHDQARRLGITTVGDIFRTVFDVEPCRA